MQELSFLLHPQTSFDFLYNFGDISVHILKFGNPFVGSALKTLLFSVAIFMYTEFAI
jgi:hypothetical protein